MHDGGMGLLGTWWSLISDRGSRRRAAYAKLVCSPKAIREDRLAAIEYFLTMDKAELVVPVLLKRFDFHLEHGLFDEKEKEICFAGILHFGEAAVPHALQHLRESPLIAWPAKILAKLLPEERLLEELKSCLNYDYIDFDEALINKNLDILRFLADFKLPGFTERLLHFLDEHDERIRFACVEVLLAQDDLEIPGILSRFLMDTSAENRRLRRAVVDAFVDRQWTVPNPESIPNGIVEPGVMMDDARHLRRVETPHLEPLNFLI